MWKRRRIKIVFTVNRRYKFAYNCSATVNINSSGELIEYICEDIEDLEDVEFLETIGPEYEDDEIPNEADITEEDIYEVKQIYL
jgi:hypothetical protein